MYQRYLLKRMKRSVTNKFDRHTAAFDWDKAMSARTFAEFDDWVTAPLHGFAGMQDYYDRCSSVHFLKYIERPASDHQCPGRPVHDAETSSRAKMPCQIT